MARRKKAKETAPVAPVAPGSLRGREWRRFLKGPDTELLEQLYEPALREAVRYDRCCSYYSSSVMAAAARGFGGLIERLLSMGQGAPRPAVRLVVNEELTTDDVRALTETGDLAVLTKQLKTRFKRPTDALQKHRLAMLGWLVREGYLDVRVGVMRRTEGIVHGKFGVITDENGDAVVFSGSGNESARGLAANYERIEVSASWGDPERHDEYVQEFAALWADEHPDVHTVTLPDALRLDLIKFAPEEPPLEMPVAAAKRQKLTMLWQFMMEAPYLENGEDACDGTAFVTAWPHQGRVADDAAAAWPDGRLLCDEVGLGKTIEAIFVLRRLMAGRGVARALLLLPKSLVQQWQAELREKGGLLVPRLDGVTHLAWPDGTRTKVAGLAEALQENVLLMSRETARLDANLRILLEAEPWDLVLLDEAHAARRLRREEGEFNQGTLLLNMLRQLQLRRKARGILLLSATPMQTSPWEPWDLLGTIGEGGEWMSGFDVVRRFYGGIAALDDGPCTLPMAMRVAQVVASDPAFHDSVDPAVDAGDVEAVARALAFASSSQRPRLQQWLRNGCPLGRRMQRNTRDTLRAYHRMGLLDEEPPRRNLQDPVFDFQDADERAVYDSVTGYIDRRFEMLEKEKPGKGFVMTIYRRRAASSPFALQRSLERRSEGLRRVARRYSYDAYLVAEDVPEALDVEDLPEDESEGISAAFPADPQVAQQELEEVDELLSQLQLLGTRDSKRDEFYEVLKAISSDGRPVLVFTQYVDTMVYLRDGLTPWLGAGVGCYSGDGGARWKDGEWRSVTKDAITKALADGELRVMVCTDAASEGLNLQAAGAVINYDLPWNPSRVEQRIGRVDRIGQRYPVVHVVNLYLKDSVDDRVYKVLRERCGLFEDFVGPMQPVLARARQMLMGREDVSAEELVRTAAEVKQDRLPHEMYLSAAAVAPRAATNPVSIADLAEALEAADGEAGVRVRRRKKDGVLQVTGLGKRKLACGSTEEQLEADPAARPLSLFDPDLKRLAAKLARAGDRLPLVVGTHTSGGFRVSVALWVVDGKPKPLTSVADLKARLARWAGDCPSPEAWQSALKRARREAKRRVQEMQERAAEREERARLGQVEAAGIRLRKELGRHLVCLGSDPYGLNQALYQQIQRQTAGSRRLRACLTRLCVDGAYPEWPEGLCRELQEFEAGVTPGQRRAWQAGSQLDAALADPRWVAER